MRLVIDGHQFAASVHERPNGNAIIRFRIDKDKKLWSTSAGVPREKQVSQSKVVSLVSEWWEENKLRVLPKEPAAAPSNALDLVSEIHRYIAEEYQYQVKEHTDQVRTVLLQMAALVPGKSVQEVTRKVFREIIRPAMTAKIAPKTWDNKRSYLLGFFRWEMEQEDEEGNPNLEKDPMIGDKAPPSTLFGTHEEVWPVETYLAVSEWLGKHRDRGKEFQAVLEDAWFTGMDNKDLCQFEPRRDLLPAKVKDSRGQVKEAWKIYKMRSKESEVIDQPVDSAIRARWLRRREECGPGDVLHPIVKTYADSHSFGRHMLRLVHRAMAELSLPRLDIKSIRHTFATRWAQVYLESRGKQGPSPEELAKWLGHARGSTIARRVYDKNKAWVDPDTV